MKKYHSFISFVAWICIGNRIVRDMRSKLFSSILHQEIAFFDKSKTGELVNRLSTDTSLVGESVTLNISDGLRSIIQAVAGISMMVGNCTYTVFF